MTTRVVCRFFKEGPTGTEIPSEGYLLWAPTRRRNEVNPTRVVLPPPFPAFLENGVCEVLVDPTDGTWAWTVLEMLEGGDKNLRTYAVPDVPEVDYNTLQLLDPTTLEATESVVAAWEATVAEVQGYVAAAAASASAASDSEAAAAGSAAAAVVSAGAALSSEEAAGLAAAAAEDFKLAAQAAAAAAQATKDEIDATIASEVQSYLTTNPPADGDAGREVELQVGTTHVQWRYAGDVQWTDLIALSALIGLPGASVELQTTATHVQWRQEGGTWTDLVALTVLTGAPGAPGASAYDVAVSNGFDGSEVEWLASLQGKDGATALSDVSDGTLTNPQTGDTPVFNEATGKWEKVSLSSTYAPIPTGTPDGSKFYRDDGTWASVTASLTLVEDPDHPGLYLISITEPVAEWAPTDLTSLVAWYDASDATTITETAGAVSQWADKSGNAYHATQANATYMPQTGVKTINGLNALDFPLSKLEVAAMTVSQPLTVAAVVQYDTVSSNKIAISLGTVYALTTRNLFFASYAGSYAQSTLAVDTAAHLHLINIAAGTSVMRADGTQIVSAAAGANNGSLLRLGTSGLSNPDPLYSMDGTIAEVVICSATLSPEDSTALETYLADKWGITLP